MLKDITEAFYLAKSKMGFVGNLWKAFKREYFTNKRSRRINWTGLVFIWIIYACASLPFWAWVIGTVYMLVFASAVGIVMYRKYPGQYAGKYFDAERAVRENSTELDIALGTSSEEYERFLKSLINNPKYSSDKRV